MRAYIVCASVFFSSRRGHTRYWRDWSSDVCSSDLNPHFRRAGSRSESLSRLWGMRDSRAGVKCSDLDPALLIWGLRRRVDLSALPDRHVVLRFEFSGVPASRTQFRIMWLILGRSGVDVCMKDPGFAVDLTLRGNIRDYVEVYLGHTKWRDAAGTTLQLDGDLQIARAFPVWLRFETVSGRTAPAPHLAARPVPVQTDHSDRLPPRPRGMRA